MALNIGELVLSLVTDDSKLKRGLADDEKKVKSFGQKLRDTAQGVAMAWGGIRFAGALAPQIMESIKLASDLSETTSKVSVIFGDAKASIFEFAETAASKLGQTKQQALDAASTFAVFGKGVGLTGTELAGFSTDLVTLSSDMASFFNTNPEEAALAISSALRGEAEPIRAYGVLLDEATIKAKAIEMGLLKSKVSVDEVAKASLNARVAQKAYNDELAQSGPKSLETQKKAQALKDAKAKLSEATKGTVGDLTKEAKLMATVGAITDQTKDAQGDFARTSDGLANQQRILTAEFTDMKAELGTALLPYALDFVTVLKDMLMWGKQNQSWLVPTIGAIAGLVAVVYLIVTAFKIWTAVSWLLNASFLANPITWIILAIIALIAVIAIIWTKSEGFRKFFIGVWEHIWSFLKMIGAWFAGPFAGFFVRWWGETKAIFNKAVSWIVEKFTWWVNFVKSLPGKITGFFRDIGQGMYAGIAWAINKIIDAWNSLDFGISISIPEWVPGLGGKGFTINDVIPDIPRLAKGGVVPGSTHGTPVIMGDGGHAEIGAPEPLLRKIFREERARGGAGLDWQGTLLLEGTGMLKGIRKTVRIGGGNPDVVLVGG